MAVKSSLIDESEIEFDEFVRRCVIAVQGGGVYGVSLLGQLQAIEDYSLKADALAGTSAGAVIATLYWVGYTPRDILSILKRWARTRQLVALLGPPDPETDISLVDLVSLLAIPRGGARAACCTLARRAVRRWRLLRTATKRLFQRSGLYDGTVLERRIDELVRASPLCAEYSELLPRQGLVTFGDIARVLGERSLSLPILFLTMTSLDRRDIVIVNSRDEKYADVELARAVRASAGFPGAFAPVPITLGDKKCYYSDGGIILNFPAYAFVKEYRKLVSPKLPYVTIGLRLAPPGDVTIDCSKPMGPWKALFGLLTGEARSWLETELSEGCPYFISIPQPLGPDAEAPSHVMAVSDLTEDRIQRMFDAARRFAIRRMKGCRFGLPSAAVGDLIQERLARLVRECALLLDVKDPDTGHVLRSNVFLACSGTGRDGKRVVRLVLKYAHNMEGDPDEHMVFELHQGLVGLVFSMREPLWCDPRKFLEETKLGGPLWGPGELRWNEALNAKVRPDRNFLLSVPILDPAHLGAEIATSVKQAVRNASEKDPSLGSAAEFLDVGGMPPFGVLALDGNLLNSEGSPADVNLDAAVSCMRLASLDIGLLLAYAFHPKER